MLFAIVIAVSLLGSLLLAVGLFVQKGREGVDLSPRSLLRVYLYVASLAGVIVAAGGLAALLTFGLAGVFGRDPIYGGATYLTQPAPACPPGEKCLEVVSAEEQRRQLALQQDRRAREDLIRGVTFTLFGLLFFGVHRVARRALALDDGRSLLQRAYYMLGTLAFGIATIALLPSGVTTAVSNALLTADPTQYRQPAGESLAGGIVALVVWLTYLRLVVLDFRRAERGAPAA